MKTLLNYTILAVCLNGGVAMITNLLDTPIPVPFDLTQFIEEQDDLGRQTADPDSLDPTQIFGQFLHITEVVINSITFQYFLSVLQVLPLPDDFVLTMQAILGVAFLFTIIYMMSGRAVSLGP